MIDSIVLRVHNLSKYEKTYNLFFSLKKSNTITRAYVETTTGEYLESEQDLVVLFHDSLRFCAVDQRSMRRLPSSHSDIACFINNTRDYLEMNFSIPKFLFSTNIMQFYQLTDEGMNATYNILMKFLANFFKDHFPEKIELEDIEIHRIDPCYNQFHFSKGASLDYLEKQKGLVMKSARSSFNTYQPSSYATSWQFVTDRYSFKCYHKGTEFRAKDYKRLTSGPRPNPRNLPLQHFLDESDRILRYEMTVRASYMNYLWNNIYYKCNDTSDYYQYSKFSDAPMRQIFARFMAYDPNDIDKYFNRQKSFRLASAWDHTRDTDVLINEPNVTFGRDIFFCIMDSFRKKLHEFQLEKLLSVSEVNSRLDKLNKDAEFKTFLRSNYGPTKKKRTTLVRAPSEKKDKGRIIALAMLAQFTDISSLKPFMAKRSFERVTADLKAIGITPQSKDLNIPLPRTDYWDYRLSFGHYHNLYL